MVDNEVLEYNCLEKELDKIAEHFRRSYKDRAQSIDRWEKMLGQMQERDRQIEFVSMVNRFD